MRVVLDIPDLDSVMEGYEFTGENLRLNMGDLYLADKCGVWEVMTWTFDHISGFSAIIVRKIKPEIWMPKEGQEYQRLILCLEYWRDDQLNHTHRDSGNVFKTGSIDLNIAIKTIRSDIDDQVK